MKDKDVKTLIIRFFISPNPNESKSVARVVYPRHWPTTRDRRYIFLLKMSKYFY